VIYNFWISIEGRLFFIAILATTLALGCLVGALWVFWRKYLVDDLPAAKTQGVFIGLVELKGSLPET